MKPLCFALLVVTVAGCGDNAPQGGSVNSFPIIDPNNPATITKWESSVYNFADAKIDVRQLRYLHGSLGSAKPKEEASVAIQIYGAKTNGIADEQATAITNLVENERAIHQAVRSAVYEHYEQTYPAWKEGLALGAAMFGGADEIDKILPKVTKGDELDSLITFTTIYVHPPRDGESCIGLDLHIPCDEENGLGLRIQGDEIIAIGTAHEAFPVPNR